jgi:hypothetical protein
MVDAKHAPEPDAPSPARPTEELQPAEEQHKEGSSELKRLFPPAEEDRERAARKENRRRQAAEPQRRTEDPYAKQHTTTAAQRRHRSPPKSRAIHNMKDFMTGIWEPFAHPGANR